MRVEADRVLGQAAIGGPAKVLFLRYAFGSQGVSNTVADLHEAKRVTEDYAGHRAKPCSLSWDLADVSISYAHGRLMMQMALLGMDALPKGGTLMVTIARDGDNLAFTVRAKGQRARLAADTISGLKAEPPADGWSADKIQPAFAHMVADSLGSRIAGTLVSDEEVVFQASGIQPAE